MSVKDGSTSEEWSEVVSHLAGFSYGIAPDGHTVCLGEESSVKELIAGSSPTATGSVIQGIIGLERELTNKKEVKKEVEESGKQGDSGTKPSRVEARSSRGQRTTRTGNIRRKTEVDRNVWNSRICRGL